MKDIEEIGAAVRAGIAKSFIENLPEDTKNAIMAASIEKTLDNLCTSYSMQEEVRNQLHGSVMVYVVEYIKDPGVQELLKKSAHEAVDTMFAAITKSITLEMQRNIESKYHKFVTGD